MPLPISATSAPPISVPASITFPNSISPGKTGGREGFSSFLADAISHVNQVQQSSQSAVEKFLSGEDEEVHKVALATQEAEITLDLFMQIRNKVIQAYQQVMQMQM